MKDFFKMFFASALAMGLVVFVGVLFMIVVLVGIGSMAEPVAEVADESVLVFDMSANIQDSPVGLSQQEILNEALGKKGPSRLSLRQTLRAIEAAGDDTRIKALYLRGSNMPQGYASGFAALREVRQAILDFKESGKPVIANVVYPNARDLYMVSAADTVYMNPEGLILNSGMASQPLFLGGFFKKYGIGVQVTKAGEFKSAAETLVREDMSAPAREQTTALLATLWSEYLKAIGEKTGLSQDEFQELIDRKGFLTAYDAEEIGLVDELAFADSILPRLLELGGEGEKEAEFSATSLSSYVQGLDAGKSARKAQVAVVYAEGSIVTGEGANGQMGGDRIAREIRMLREKDNVKAIVLRVNSPGGSALASEVIQREVLLANEKIPVVVSMGTVAASGGYWISAYSDRIFAEPNTITGSIGVIGAFINFQDLASSHGLNFDIVKTGKYADMMTPTRPKTDEEMELIQAWVDKTYGDFLSKVAEGRSLPMETVAEIAEGRVWSGADALKLGLVDELGGLSDAIAYAANLAGLGEDPAVRDYPKAKDFFEELKKSLMSASIEEIAGGVYAPAASALSEIKSLSRFNDPKGAYAILPFNIEIE